MQADIERKPVIRLDQALTLWEDTCFLIGARSRIELANGFPLTAPIGAPFTTYQDFRRHVLRSAEEGQEFNRAKFLGTDKRVSAAIGPIGSIPETLYGWNKHSRRVFSLDVDISKQLSDTDLEGILWSDVKFPFRAYAMELKAPLRFRGEDISDFIAINEISVPDGREAITLSLLPIYLDQAPYLNYKQRQRLTDLIARRKFRQADNLFQEINSRETVVGIPHLLLDKSQLDFPVMDTETITSRLGLTSNPDERQLLEDATRLVVGFCLYLKQLPIGGRYQSEWSQVPSSPDPIAITNEAQVCYITSTHPLVRKINDGSTGASGRGGYEMPWHQRRGYWSREKGKGSDPSAPKLIWHAPTEVRRDRKPVGDSIPGGAQTNV